MDILWTDIWGVQLINDVDQRCWDSLPQPYPHLGLRLKRAACQQGCLNGNNVSMHISWLHTLHQTRIMACADWGKG